jgi:dihydroorotase-like cyclic amidohydrolase
MLLFKGRRVVFNGGEVHPASLTVTGGQITAISNDYSPGEDDPGYDKVSAFLLVFPRMYYDDSCW